MSRASQIYNLINTLSRGEKRQFKVQVSKYDKEEKNITSQLFDLMEGLRSWDEEDFKVKADKAGLGKYLAVHSNNLLSQLMESLRMKEADSNLILRINKLTEECMLLYSRDEYDLAMSRLKKAGKLAKETELFEKQLEILFREREVQSRILNTAEYHEYRPQFFKRVKDTIAHLDNQAEYFNLVEDIFSVYRTIGHPQKQSDAALYEDIINNPLMKDESLALGSHAKISFYYVHYMYFLGQNDIENSVISSDKQVEVFEKNMQFAKAHINTYISILNNRAVVLAQMDNAPEFMKTVKKLRSIPERFSIRHKSVQQQVFEYSYNEEMDYYLIRDMIDEAGSIAPVVEAEIVRLGKEGIPFRRFLNQALRLAIYYYRNKEVERAHYWVKRVLEHDRGKHEIHIDTFATILDLILHFQSGDYEYLRYRINNVQKHFKKTKQLIPVNEHFLNLLRQLIKVKDVPEIDKALSEFSKEFDELPDSLNKIFYERFLAIKEQVKNRFGLDEQLNQAAVAT